MVSFYILLFWAGIFLVLYTYLGYGILLWFLTKIFKKRTVQSTTDEQLPAVTHIIAAYDEEQIIEEKINNTITLDYPPDKYTIFFVTDGSTDRTAEIVARYPAIKLFHSTERKGKIHAVNRVMKMVETPVVIFSDANTLLNDAALKNITRHYYDQTVGGVAGEKRIFKNEADSASGAGEGLYWKYESFLKKKDSELYSVVGAAGELFSIRTELFEEPPPNSIIEDFYISLKIAARGYRFIYEPDATATETASASIQEEWKRKVRICAGGFQSMRWLRFLLNPFRYGVLSFQYVSHRVLRWTLAPLALPIILLTNMYLAWLGMPLYNIILLAQALFYFMALLGWLMQNKKVSIKGFFVPYYFMVMNLSVYAGFMRYIKGQQSVVWEKSKRAPAG